ncbi:formylglycine-generating enzyme family protein [Maridesulfovibrio sp.]|uniref:formylglycine-generating enzyme family protein n=1 Tax=Maridesulfovibrio sp. TaxID=2795000 RepID=UPI0039EE00D5
MGKSIKFNASGAVGRSDLVYLLNKRPDIPRDVLASMLGYEYTAPKASQGTEGSAEAKSSTASGVEGRPISGEGWESTLEPKFWCIKERKRRDSKQGKISKSRDKKTQPSLPNISSTSEPPPKVPLIPWRRLWPVLKGILQGDIHSSQPDEREVLQILSRGEALTHIPLKKRKTWASFSKIIMDGSRRMSPFRDDFHWIIAGVRKLTGPSRLEFCCLSEGPLNHAFYPESGKFKHVDVDQSGAPLLILSDLGAFGTADERFQWAAFGRTLCDSGIQPVVLTPAPKDMWDDEHSNLFRQICLDDFASLSAKISEDKTGPAHGDVGGQDYVEDLLTLLSPAVYIDTGLVRSMRGLFPNATAGIEAIVWNHGAVNTFYKSILFKPTEQQRYRKKFSEIPDKEIKEKALKLIEIHHKFLAPEVQLEERLTQHVLRKEFDEYVSIPKEVSDFLSWLGECLDKAQSSEVSAVEAWVKRMCWRQLDEVREVDDSGQLLKTAAKVFAKEWAAHESKEIPSFLTEDDFNTAKNKDEKRNIWELRTLGNQLHLFSKSAEEKKSVLIASLEGHRLIKYGPIDNLKQRTFAEGLSIPTPYDSNIVLKSKFESIILTSEPKPDWAESIYRDGTGLYATLPLNKSKIQYVLPSEIDLVQDYSHSIEEDDNNDGILRLDGSPLDGSSLLSGDRLSSAASFLSKIIRKHTGDNYEKGFWLNLSQLQQILESGVPDVSWADSYCLDQYGFYADLNIMGVTQRMRWIQPGTFMMGSPEDEPERSVDEIQHKVILTEGFWLSDTACTQELWEKVIGNNPSYFKGEAQLPVENVSWDNCHEFLQVVNKELEGFNIQLPTEAEWEYACRAGTETPFSFGENITTKQVNYDGNNPYKNGVKGEFREKTVAVKELPCNQWGLFQMHGNVWEWCADRYGEYEQESVKDPKGPADGESRVLRGGSWILNGRDVRSAVRNWLTPGNRNVIIGFRFSLGQKG